MEKKYYIIAQDWTDAMNRQREDKEKIKNRWPKATVFGINIYPNPREVTISMRVEDIERTIYYVSYTYLDKWLKGHRNVVHVGEINDIIMEVDRELFEKHKVLELHIKDVDAKSYISPAKFEIGEYVMDITKTSCTGVITRKTMFGSEPYYMLEGYTCWFAEHNLVAIDVHDMYPMKMFESAVDAQLHFYWQKVYYQRLLEKKIEKENKEMKFKVGDYVKVKENLEGGKSYDGIFFAQKMCKYRGKIYKISYVDEDGYCHYHLEGCTDDDFILKGINWSFNDEMLEPAAKYKIGDFVEYRTTYRGRITDIRYHQKKFRNDYFILYKLIDTRYECDNLWFHEEDLKKINTPKLILGTSKAPKLDFKSIDNLQKRLYEALDLKPLRSAKDDSIDAIALPIAINSVYGIYSTTPKQPEIDKVMPNEKKKAVTVKFKDGDVVTVKCSKDDKFDIYTGVAHAIAKKMFKTGSHFKKVVDNLTVQDKSKKKEKVKEDKKDDKTVQETKKSSKTKKAA